MATVQFFGIEQVMEAAENLNCPAWGIFISRALFTKYEGSDMSESLQLLQKNLEALGKSGTTGIYTIKFFEADAGKTIKINERTVCDGGSFNFKLIEPEERESRLIGNSSQYGIIAEMRKKIEDLEKKLEQAEEYEAPDEDQSIGAIVMDLIKNPDQLGQLVNIGRAALGLPIQSIPASIGSLPSSPAVVMNQEQKEKDLERLSDAIDVLEKADPRLVDHLEKLAKMATDNPAQFRATVSMLDLK
jgi:hypothetical protein